MRWRRPPPSEDAWKATEPAPDEEEEDTWDLGPEVEIAPGRSLLKYLGGGYHYEVHLAWDETLYSLVVAKLLRPSKAHDHRALRDMQREAAILARLAHPGLARGFDTRVDSQYPHLLLEYLDGPTLRDLIWRHGVAPLEQLLPLVLGAVAVLHYMSLEHVVHLDVKPGNIVMGLPPRLLDLSVARTVESAARLKHAVGTSLYMAPEQCDPRAHPGSVGPPSDIFGLGVTLYEAATGERPFPAGQDGADDPKVEYPQLVLDPAPPPKDLPPEVADLILGMLARNPADRPVASEVAAALEPLVDEVSP